MWNGFEDVDARNKCGHDESEIVAVGIKPHGEERGSAARLEPRGPRRLVEAERDGQ
jgi:hypothetical protein